EALFAADSTAALAIVAMLDGDAGADARWRLALRGIDQLLDDLGFDLARKTRLIERQRDTFAREHAADTRLQRQLGDRFRRERVSGERLLDRAHDATSELAPALDAFAARSETMRAIAPALVATDGDKVSLDALAASFVHLHVNRMLRSDARAHELVLYDFLAR